jgi:hypothetical protein
VNVELAASTVLFGTKEVLHSYSVVMLTNVYTNPNKFVFKFLSFPPSPAEVRCIGELVGIGIT